MKLGLGLYSESLTDENLRFANQCGATHIVAQLVNYIKGSNPKVARGNLDGWGETYNQDKLWTLDQLVSLRKKIEGHGLTLEAIENFDPSHWYDILLDGPLKVKQTENLKQLIRNMGRAGIPVMGYYFSLAGVWGWTTAPVGRGQSNSILFDTDQIDVDAKIPEGMVWNMTYAQKNGKFLPTITREELWSRLDYFLQNILPIAEEEGVKLVAHPDDPPLPYLRNNPRLFYNTAEYEKLLTKYPSKANGFEFCMGTVQEMQDSDVYQMLDKYSENDRIGYIHFRNVVGKVPLYREAFVDEGDIDMVKALKILKNNHYEGVLIPDHTPEMSCDAPWHAGMAFALGYMKGAIQSLNSF
jgi:mannonate dehydratase